MDSVSEVISMPDNRILLADDDVEFRGAVEQFLRSWGYDVISVKHGLDAWQVLLSDAPPRLMILDWIMPGMDGLEVCRRLRSQPDEPYSYIIMLTVLDEMEMLFEGFRAGADDYLTKPVLPQELKARLMAGRRVLEKQEKTRKDLDTLQLQALQDPLTGLWNRSGIMRILRRELSRVTRLPQPLSVLMLDLDNFKLINDTYGHPAGDSVLRMVSKKISSSLRDYDAIGRIGGDEFLVVLPECDGDAARALGERVRAKLEETSFQIQEDETPVTMSVGAASVYGGLGIDVDDLIWEADAALLAAKHSGRNKVESRMGVSASFQFA